MHIYTHMNEWLSEWNHDTLLKVYLVILLHLLSYYSCCELFILVMNKIIIISNLNIYLKQVIKHYNKIVSYLSLNTNISNVHLNINCKVHGPQNPFKRGWFPYNVAIPLYFFSKAIIHWRWTSYPIVCLIIFFQNSSKKIRSTFCEAYMFDKL